MQNSLLAKLMVTWTGFICCLLYTGVIFIYFKFDKIFKKLEYEKTRKDKIWDMVFWVMLVVGYSFWTWTIVRIWK